MTIKKYRVVIISVSLMVFAVALVVALSTGYKRTKVVRIGIVNVTPRLNPVVDGFKSGMAKAGFVEGKNLIYIYKGAIYVHEVDDALRSLVTGNVDLIFAMTTPVAQKAKEAVKGTRIPVVFAPVLYPVESGLVESLTHPGGNLTGIKVGGSTGKALEWHKAIVPGTKKMFVPCRCGDEPSERSTEELRKAAAKVGIKLVIAEVDTESQLKEAFDNIPRDVDSIWLLNSPFLSSHIDIYLKAAKKNRLPISTGTSQYKAGVMVSYGHDPFRTGEGAGRLASKILEGVSPADLPVETSEFYLSINLRAARAIGIEIKDEVLQQADNIVR